MARVYLRCPACGKLARPEALTGAGTHDLVLRRVDRGLGRGRGFEWSRVPCPPAVLRLLSEVLERAQTQVQNLLAVSTDAADRDRGTP